MNVYRLGLFVIVCFIWFSCAENNQSSEGDSELKDSLTLGNKKGEEDVSVSPTLSEDRREFIETYYEEIQIDTTIYVGGDSLEVFLKYYSLNDSAVIIPAKYIWEDELEVFVTHNFVSQIQVKNNDQIIYSKTISKEDFNDLTTETLRKYGILMYPSFRGYDSNEKEFIFHYSISIPATDVGTSATLHVGLDGNERVTEY